MLKVTPIQSFIDGCIPILVGGFPLKNMKVSWDYYFQYMGK
jgi:hypothetical protein